MFIFATAIGSLVLSHKGIHNNTILSILKIGLILALIYLLICFLEGAQCAVTVVKGLGAVMLAKGYRFCL